MAEYYLCTSCTAGVCNDDWTWLDYVYSTAVLCSHGHHAPHEGCSEFESGDVDSDSGRKYRQVSAWMERVGYLAFDSYYERDNDELCPCCRDVFVCEGGRFTGCADLAEV